MKCYDDWGRFFTLEENFTPIFEKDKKEDSENYTLVSFTLIPESVIEQLIVIEITISSAS